MITTISWRESLAGLVFNVWLAQALERTIIVDDSDAQVDYSGGVWSVSTGSEYFGSTVHVTKTPGSQATLHFNGTSVRVYGTVSSNSADSVCNVDGIEQDVSLSSDTVEYQILLCQFSDLTEDSQHTLSIRHSGVTGKAMVLDHFILTQTVATSTNSSTQPSSSDTDQTTVNIGAVVGAVIGGLIIVGVTLWWVIRYYRSGRTRDRRMSKKTIDRSFSTRWVQTSNQPSPTTPKSPGWVMNFPSLPKQHTESNENLTTFKSTRMVEKRMNSDRSYPLLRLRESRFGAPIPEPMTRSPDPDTLEDRYAERPSHFTRPSMHESIFSVQTRSVAPSLHSRNSIQSMNSIQSRHSIASLHSNGPHAMGNSRTSLTQGPHPIIQDSPWGRSSYFEVTAPQPRIRDPEREEIERPWSIAISAEGEGWSTPFSNDVGWAGERLERSETPLEVISVPRNRTRSQPDPAPALVASRPRPRTSSDPRHPPPTIPLPATPSRVHAHHRSPNPSDGDFVFLLRPPTSASEPRSRVIDLPDTPSSSHHAYSFTSSPATSPNPNLAWRQLPEVQVHK